MSADALDPATPQTQLPCLGCGKRDGLMAPIKGNAEVFYCNRCGTLMDTAEKPVTALIPLLTRNVLLALGEQDPSSAAQESAQGIGRPSGDPSGKPSTHPVDEPSAKKPS